MVQLLVLTRKKGEWGEWDSLDLTDLKWREHKQGLILGWSGIQKGSSSFMVLAPPRPRPMAMRPRKIVIWAVQSVPACLTDLVARPKSELRRYRTVGSVGSVGPPPPINDVVRCSAPHSYRQFLQRVAPAACCTGNAEPWRWAPRRMWSSGGEVDDSMPGLRIRSLTLTWLSFTPPHPPSSSLWTVHSFPPFLCHLFHFILIRTFIVGCGNNGCRAFRPSPQLPSSSLSALRASPVPSLIVTV